MRAQPRLPWWAKDTTRPVLPPTHPHSRTLRSTATKTLALTAAALALTTVLRGTTSPDTWPTEGGGTAHRQTMQALLGACGPTYTFTAQPGQAGPVPTTHTDGTPNTQQYRTIVPMIGHYHPPHTAPTTRFYPPDANNIPTVETLLGWQSQGTITAYYTTDAHPADITALRDLATNPDLDMVVIPWESTGRPPLPAHRKIGYATWGASQTCQRLNAAALAEFRQAHPPTVARAEAQAAAATRARKP